MQAEDKYLDAGVRGYIVRTAHKNFWKVAAYYEMDDLIQDGYLCYAKCKAGFRADETKPPEEEQRRFMGFFQMAFQNHITDLANNRSNTPETVIASLPEDQADGIEAWAAHASELSDASLAVLITQAPAEIVDILKLILVDGVANGPYLKSKLRQKFLPSSPIPRIVKGRRKLRETTEQHYDRCLGRPGVIAQLRQYFLGSEEPDLLDKLVGCLFNGEDAKPASMI